MKIAICFVVLIAVTVNASLEDEFYKLEKDVRDKLVSKVMKATGSLKELVDNLKEMKKAFPDDFKTVDSKLTTFITNIEELLTDAKELYEDKKQGKSFSLAIKMVEAGAKFTEVESELKSMKPLFYKMIKDRLVGAKSALGDLEDLLKGITTNSGSIAEELSKVSDVISKEVPTSIFAKIATAYVKVKSALAKIEELAKQYPEVYESVKSEIPDLESTLKSLYEDIMAVAADKKKGDTIMMMIKVASAGEKLSTLMSIVDKVKPELEHLLGETKGSAKAAIEEVQKILDILHPTAKNGKFDDNMLEDLLKTVIGELKTKYLGKIFNFLEHLDSYVKSMKTKYHDIKGSVMQKLIQIETSGKKLVADFNKLYQDSKHAHVISAIEDVNTIRKQLETLEAQLDVVGDLTEGKEKLHSIVEEAHKLISVLKEVEEHI